MTSLSLHTPHAADKPPIKGLFSSFHKAALAAACLLALGTGVHAIFDRKLPPRILELQVNELAARAKVSHASPADYQDVAGAKLAPEVAALADKFQLKAFNPGSLHRLTDNRKLLVASDIGDKWTMTTHANEPIPGLYWKGSALQHKWGGNVAVYAGDGLILVSFSNVPQYMCDQAFVAENAGDMSYVFACNGRLTAVEHGTSWNVAAADLHPIKKAPLSYKPSA